MTDHSQKNPDNTNSGVRFNHPSAVPVISMRVSEDGPRVHLGHVKSAENFYWFFDAETSKKSVIAPYLEGTLASLSGTNASFGIGALASEIARLEKTGYKFTEEDRAVLKAVQHDLTKRKPENFPDEKARAAYEDGLRNIDQLYRKIGGVSGPAAPTPTALSMETSGRYSVNATVKDAQNAMSELKKLGVAGIDLGAFGAGKDGVDGKFGQKTRDSVIAAQKALGMEPDGKITDDFINKMQAKIDELKAKPESALAAPDKKPADILPHWTEKEWRDPRIVVEERIRKFEENPGFKKRLNATVKDTQNAMSELKKLGVAGIDLGACGVAKDGVDGEFGRKTHDSVIAAQKALGMEPDGKITDDFMKKMQAKIDELKAKPAHTQRPDIQGEISQVISLKGDPGQNILNVGNLASYYGLGTGIDLSQGGGLGANPLVSEVQFGRAQAPKV